MAKIAVELEQAVARRKQTANAQTISLRILAEGPGWRVADVLCTSGPQDRAFEERHDRVSISLVTAGTFQYRSGNERAMMTPGSLLLGNPRQAFECGHEHGEGDRCISFQYQPEVFEEIAVDAGGAKRFDLLRMPPVRELSALTSQAVAGLGRTDEASWEELSVALAARTAQMAAESSISHGELPAGALARVTRIVRRMDHEMAAPHRLETLARESRLSPFHFLRTFERLTGLTPHQYILRTRLRRAAVRLLADSEKILDIALDCGFGDVSNFNRAFRTEFGMNPRAYRAQ